MYQITYITWWANKTSRACKWKISPVEWRLKSDFYNSTLIDNQSGNYYNTKNTNIGSQWGFRRDSCYGIISQNLYASRLVYGLYLLAAFRAAFCHNNISIGELGVLTWLSLSNDLYHTFWRMLLNMCLLWLLRNKCGTINKDKLTSKVSNPQSHCSYQLSALNGKFKFKWICDSSGIWLSAIICHKCTDLAQNWHSFGQIGETSCIRGSARRIWNRFRIWAGYSVRRWRSSPTNHPDCEGVQLEKGEWTKICKYKNIPVFSTFIAHSRLRFEPGFVFGMRFYSKCN